MIGYGIARSHLESRKENLAALSVMNLLLTQRHLFLPTLPEGFILSLLATHTHTHTHREVGTSSTGGEKARMDIFSWQEALISR